MENKNLKEDILQMSKEIRYDYRRAVLVMFLSMFLLESVSLADIILIRECEDSWTPILIVSLLMAGVVASLMAYMRCAIIVGRMRSLEDDIRRLTDDSSNHQ